MKLAYRAFLITLTIMALMISVSAQTLRPEKDPRNVAPTVGTGGPVGGATGLFTVYDGQTLRKGEWTLSLAFSNYDRDPGDVDISEIPASFQIGLNDYVEFFFNTDGYRQINSNSPRNLSSLYLPNASFGGGPAVVLAPNGLLNGQYAGQAIYRPIGNQPFAPYPFTGASAGTFWFLNGQQGNPTLGPPSPGGAASLFPGIGSIYGGILPGIVLQTQQVPIPNPPLPPVGFRDVPTVFTVAPSYLNDAPLLGRENGDTSFNTYSVGAKIRFTSPNNPIGVGVVPFYRFYADAPNSISGFSQLQQGGSPGARRGDIGLVGFADARVRKWMNISANVGYINNGDITANGATLLDRGDELLAAFAVDFPVNKFFQPILEARSLQYVGGRTPNTFENNPIDLIAGARWFPARWISLGAAYRYHANAQDLDSLEDVDFNNFVTIPCIQLAGNPACTPTVIATQTQGRIPGFRTSRDPHGFMLQIAAGRRNERADEVINKPATINSVDMSKTVVKKPCKPGFRPAEGESCDDNQTVNVRTSATDPENDVLTYNYTVSGGRIVGQGANVSWDLSDASPGDYTLTVAVDDGCGVCSDPMTKTVKVEECNCVKVCNCGELTVSGPPAVVQPGENMTFRATVSGGDGSNVTYNWTVTNGNIISGQGTPSIVVGGTDPNETITANVTAKTGDCDECVRSGSDTGVVAGRPTPDLIDDFGKLPDNDVRNRLDLFFNQLQNNPTARGYIVNSGTDREVRRVERLIRNHIEFRNFPADRITLVRGATAGDTRTRLWIVPAGADETKIN